MTICKAAVTFTILVVGYNCGKKKRKQGANGAISNKKKVSIHETNLKHIPIIISLVKDRMVTVELKLKGNM